MQLAQNPLLNRGSLFKQMKPLFNALVCVSDVERVNDQARVAIAQTMIGYSASFDMLRQNP